MKHTREWSFAFLLATGAAAIGTSAMPMTRAVSENQIVSLASAPKVISAAGSLDEAGRPGVTLEIEFANECYARTGADLTLLEDQKGGRAVLIVGQNVPPDGCPDIFQPVISSLLALLPPRLAHRDVAVLAKPSGDNVLRLVKLEGARTTATTTVAEVAADQTLPRLDSPALLPSGEGYTLTGKLKVMADCPDSEIGVHVFEVPDVQGNPSSDAILVTAPSHCVAADGGVDISVSVGTPQSLQDRRVAVVNADTVLRPAP